MQFNHTCLQELNEIVFNFKNVRVQYLSVLQSATFLQDEFLCKFEQLLTQFVLDTSNVQWKVTQGVDAFKRDQQRSIISGVLDHSVLDQLEQCNTAIVQIYLLAIEDLNKFLSHVSVQTNLAFKHRLLSQLADIDGYIALLMQHNILLVEEQPCSSILKHDPLTIISNAKFEVKLTLLFDHQLLTGGGQCSTSSPVKSPQVEVRLLKEDEIGTVQTDGLATVMAQRPSFNIIQKAEPKCALEGRRLTTAIVCMLKVDINRRGHNPKALPVAEEKFEFLFCTKVELLDREYVLHVLSLPVNVLSRKDYRNSYATIIWDCAFSLPNRRLFETRDSVPWSELASVLNCKFHKDVGVFLCAEHLEFIYTMLPNMSVNGESSGVDSGLGTSALVTWEQFAKLTLSLRQFTFFEWFYKILILVREQLAKMYCDGLIHGFISSELAENLLLNCVDGTFLIRFSETFSGAISIAYVKNRAFDKLFPWDLDRLKKISLPHTIKCSDFLLYLYPNVPKDEVFCRFYVHNEPTNRSITGKDYKRDTNIAQVINHGGYLSTIHD